MRFLLSFLDLFFFIIPRYTSDIVAIVAFEDNSWTVLCFEEELTEDDEFSFLAEYKALTFLGQDYFCTLERIE